MRKEAIKNENYLPLHRWAPSPRVACFVVVLMLLRSAAALRSLPAPAPGPAQARQGLTAGPAKLSPLSLLPPPSIQTQLQLPGSLWADPYLPPLPRALVPKHPEVEVKGAEASGRASGWPPELPCSSAEAPTSRRGHLRPADASILCHTGHPNETQAGEAPGAGRTHYQRPAPGLCKAQQVRQQTTPL